MHIKSSSVKILQSPPKMLLNIYVDSSYPLDAIICILSSPYPDVRISLYPRILRSTHPHILNKDSLFLCIFVSSHPKTLTTSHILLLRCSSSPPFSRWPGSPAASTTGSLGHHPWAGSPGRGKTTFFPKSKIQFVRFVRSPGFGATRTARTTPTTASARGSSCRWPTSSSQTATMMLDTGRLNLIKVYPQICIT